VIREIGHNLEAASSVREPRAVLKRFGDSAIEFELHFWIEKRSPQRIYESRDQEGFRVTAPEDIAAVADP